MQQTRLPSSTTYVPVPQINIIKFQQWSTKAMSYCTPPGSLMTKPNTACSSCVTLNISFEFGLQ